MRWGGGTAWLTRGAPRLGFVPPVELVRAVPLLWAWQLLVLAAPLVAMRTHYEWCAPKLTNIRPCPTLEAHQPLPTVAVLLTCFALQAHSSGSLLAACACVP